MKTIFKKLLPALIVAFVLVSALAVTALATDYSWVGDVELLDMSQSGVDKSGYSDIDGNSAWTQVSSHSAKKALAYETTMNAYWSWNYKSYYNSSTKTLVVVPTAATISSRDGNNASPVVISDNDGKVADADLEGLDTRYYAKRWSTDSAYYYYVHNFELWLNDFGKEVEHLQIRSAVTNPIITQEFGAYIADDLVNVKTIKIPEDATLRATTASASDRNQMFRNKSELTTVQYGTFASNGDFSTTCPVNAVTLKEGPLTSDVRYGVSAAIFDGCTSITRVIIESNTANYVGLRDNMFNGCTSLKFVYLGAPMSDSYLVGTDAFTGCSGVNVYVDDTAKATALAAVSGITLKAHTAYDADIEAYIYGGLLTSEGILVKIADTDTEAGKNVAIRFLFRWDATQTASVEKTPAKVGLVACSADYYANVNGDTEKEKLDALLADTTSKVKKNDVAVYENGKMSLVGKFLADGTDENAGVYSYAYTLYGIPAANYDSEIYAATYIEWSDGSYSVTSNSYTDYNSKTKNTISLYDVTLGLFKQGLINSEKVADKYLWNVIEGMKVHSHSMTGTANGGSNVDYLFFPDNIDGGYVLAYRPTEKYAEDGVTLKGATIPHNGNYWGAPGKLAASTTYYYQTHTIVVDHGVTSVGGARIFGGPYSETLYNETVKTVVYPNGFSLDSGKTTEATHAFHMLPYLQDVIWCHTDSDGNYVKHMSDITWSDNCVQKNQLIDLRGFGTTVGSSTTGQFTWDQVAAYYPAEKMNIIVSSDCTISAAVGARKIIWKAS